GLHDGQTQLGSGRPGDFHLDDGVDLTRIVHDADPLRVGSDFLQQLQLGPDGSQIGGARDVGAGTLDALHQLRGDGIGHRGDENGDVLNDVRGRLGRWGSDGQNQVHAVRLELAGDGLGRCQVTLSALDVVNDVDAFRVAELAQTVDEALPSLVQGRMLDDLGNAHLDGGRLHTG